jgi:transcriptional regulator with XRE-family HTH domain
MRAERGLSLREAARRAGVVKETISGIERGHTHPYDVTLAKLAKAYEVPVEALLEEPVGAGKADAPKTGQPETAPPAEEEPTIVPQSARTLKAIVGAVKQLKKDEESYLERIRQGQLGYRDAVILDLANRGARADLSERGILEFAEAVRAGREFAEFEAIPLCHELLRELRNLEELADEARATAALRSSEIREEVKKDTYLWELRGAGSLGSENAVSRDRAG